VRRFCEFEIIIKCDRHSEQSVRILSGGFGMVCVKTAVIANLIQNLKGFFDLYKLYNIKDLIQIKFL
jgi:hypothetical protein